MLTALFIILMFAVFGKMIIFAFKASWGISPGKKEVVYGKAKEVGRKI